MGELNPFKKPDVPQIAPPPPVEEAPPPVNEADTEVVNRRKLERRRAALRSGRRSTILTSPQGLPSASSTRKTALGT